MTLVAIWRAQNRLMAIADTRIIRDPGNVLTEHGPKLLPISIVCRQPGTGGFFDKEVYRAEIGFAYAGSTLSALAAHALSNTLLSKLIGMQGAAPPSLHEIAYFVGSASAEYMREVGELAGTAGLFSAVIFGRCPQQGTLRAFELHPDISGASLRVNVHERILTPIRIRGTSAESTLVIGSSSDHLVEAIDRQLADASERGETHEIAVFNAPKSALQQLITEKVDERVGGMIQQAWATVEEGFQIVSNLVPITPRPPSTCNAGLFILGFDTSNIQSVGNYVVGGIGY